MISLQNVSHDYDGFDVLREVSLDLHEHRIAFIGANGSGKSTLARTLNGLLVPRRGTVLVDGLDTRRNAVQVRRRVGFMFSDANHQIIMPSVAEDVALGLRGQKLSKLEKADIVAEVLDRYGLLALSNHSAHLLSGGQKQMLALASVLVTQPDILICDEPTTLLDLHNVQIFLDTVRNLSQQVILMTHHLEIIEDYDRAILMDRGQVHFDGSPQDAVAAYRRLIGNREKERTGR
ncbi:ABC transporter ATP-binding protein [Pseudarthrobacter sp. H3Y2-7]|uniref:energy-coupling factor ABC transporter ATP-binding protein n=1 Tax=Pseudarthrobacter naphthalenicus TaxID=3031328 RepID=UPI0023B19CD7|nr:ABC transporter ATP-binding protein [Pseudarthrobacter sp. H3Y2-7]MDE8670869.1 ABC transporter ATP-binding protein [Pseudarthrobacter sp. H3Y2-7]